MKLHPLASVAVLSLLVACGGSKRPPVAPVAAAPPTTAAATPSPDPPPAPVAAPIPEADIKAFLVAQPGETPASSAPIPGLDELTPKEHDTLARCEAARSKALEKNAKLPLNKQFSAMVKAMEKVDKHCSELGMRDSSQASAKDRDATAQTEMHALARAITQTTSCEKGASNPHRQYCFSSSTFLWDREGWSCVGKVMKDAEKEAFASGTAYAYTFHVDDDLKTYELVGQGCDMRTGGTELVMRGQLGQPADPLTIYRRAPAKAAR